MSSSKIVILALGIGGFILMMRMHGGHRGHGAQQRGGSSGGHGSHDEDGDAARPAGEPKPAPAHEYDRHEDVAQPKPEPARAHEDFVAELVDAYSGH